MRVAVIGAGLSGLAAARELQGQGYQVVVFEKSRGVGGRLATRRLGDGATVNHGAPAIDAPAGSALAVALAGVETGPVAHQGAVDRLPFATPVVPTLGVTAFAKHLVERLDVVRSVRIARVRRVDGGYELGDEQGNGRGTFAGIVVAAPAPQAADILDEVASEHDRAAALREVVYAPSVVVMGRAVATPDITTIAEAGGPVQRVVVAPQSTPDGTTVVAYLNDELSTAMLDGAADAQIISAASSSQAVADLAGDVTWDGVKRWRYSTVATRPSAAIPMANGSAIVLSGDAVVGTGMAGVWDSGVAAAAALMAEIG